jgi:hypothetical protein
MAAGPQVAAVGADVEQWGRKVAQLTDAPRYPSRPSSELRATPLGSDGPPAPMPDGRPARFKASPVVPTVYGMQVAPSRVGGEVLVSKRDACTW